jgi:hypothetical protein
MLLGAPPLVLMRCPGGLVDVSDPCVFEIFDSECETVVVLGTSTEIPSSKEAVLAPVEDEVLKIPAAGDTVSV